jgi:tRNA nucleotidyltransferase (CCA-adding enzyme)
VNGKGMRALKEACSLFKDSATRFAVLMYAQPEDAHQQDDFKEIKRICQQYAVPNEYQELALLTARLHQKALAAQAFSPASLNKFFNALDIYRRIDRFNKFLNACYAIALSQSRSFNQPWLKECANQLKKIDVEPLLAQGLTGTKLAAALQTKREEIIKQCLVNYWKG